MIFEAKILIIRRINENRRRKKWVRGTGRERRNAEKGLETHITILSEYAYLRKKVAKLLGTSIRLS